MKPLRASVLRYGEVETIAMELLRELGRLDDIPIDVEDIVEFQMNLEVRPIRELQRQYGLDGFLGNRPKTLFVDQWIMEHRPNRYRFTLAHELGHLILHDEIARDVSIKRPEEWLEFHANLGEENREWFERQAYWFAGALLVPHDTLTCEHSKALCRISDAGLSEAAISENNRAMIAGSIAKVFGVSTEVVVRRLKKVIEGW